MASSSPLEPTRLKAVDVHAAPRRPGIYAWYARVPMGSHDWRPAINDEGTDEAAEFFLNSVARYAGFHQPNEIPLTGKGNYDMNWGGTISRMVLSASPPDSDHANLRKKLGHQLKFPDSRRALLGLFEAAVPIFTAPLYIGVADDLHVRLTTHIKEFTDTSAKLRDGALQSTESVASEGQTFGVRAAGLGIGIDHLECWYLPISWLDLDDPDSRARARQLSELAEWILQRIFLPNLGRR